MNKKNQLDTLNPNGIHYLIEFFGCNSAQIDSIEFWENVLPASVQGTSIEVLHSYFHAFKPQGVTGFLLLSSSHISIHSWPDKGYVACDIFTCASEEETNSIFEKLKNAVTHDYLNMQRVYRGYQFLNLPIFCNGDEMKIEINKILYEIQSDFQKIVIADTKQYGKCLIIDDVMQRSEKDHELYDQEMLHKLKGTDEKLLIIGGGDGDIAEQALKNNPNLHINIIDLDIAVINSAKKFLNQCIFDDKRVKLAIGDALHFLNMEDEVYDGIVCDLTDAPIGTEKEAVGFQDFFEKIISLAEKRLKQGGWISVQSGASCIAKDFTDEVAIIESILRKDNFEDITRSDIYIPSYGESCAFLFAKKK